MRRSLIPKMCTTLVMLCLWSPSKGTEIISRQELAVLKQPHIHVQVAVEKAELYATPDSSTASVWTSDWMQSLPVDSKRMAMAPKGWIPIEGTNGKMAAKGKGARPNVWIRRRDVALASDFKKVSGCWPVKSMTYVEGEYSAEVSFEMDGSALVKEWGDESIDKRPPQRAQVYMAGNIVTIDSVKRRGPTFLTSGFRPPERKLYSEDGEVDDQKLFPENTLKDCPSVPLLAP